MYVPVRVVLNHTRLQVIAIESLHHHSKINLLMPNLKRSIRTNLTLSPGHSQILSRSHGEKSGVGLGTLLRLGLEMVVSVSTY